MSEELDLPLTNRSTGRTTSVQFFTDDTIEVVRIKIGIALGIHHDRLRIYADTEIPAKYYYDDPRAWKSLFLRMSPDGKPIREISKKSYNDSRDVPFPFPEGEITEATWATDVPREFESSFHELRIIGVAEDHSWIFPLDNSTDPVVLPVAADIARPSNRSLFKSIHTLPIRGFTVIPYDETTAVRPVLKDQYVPYLKAGTPASVTENDQSTVKSQTNLVKVLTGLSVDKPKETSILRARWRIPFVETEFGESHRNRFEQIFFGMTLSEKETPYIGFFTSRKEQTRHKFYSKDELNKKPVLDLKVWAHWWTVSKPSRNRPTLVLYRGEGRSHFDRIAVTSTDIVVSSQRPEDSKESLEDMQQSIDKWLRSLDALMPFIAEKDLDRWDIQNAGLQITFDSEIKEADFRRFDCLRTIFEISDKKSLSFRFLRSNGTDLGLTPTELSVMQLIREDPGTDVGDLEDVLNLNRAEAERVYAAIQAKLDEDPSILTKASASLPSFRFSSKSVLVVSAEDVDRIIKYISILRHILTHPNESDLDSVCPKRVEIVEAVAAVPEVFQAADEGAADLGDLLDDLLGDLSDLAPAAAAAAPPVQEAAPAPAKKEKEKVKVKGGESDTLYGYLGGRLQEFDPETFTEGSKKCDLKRQPVVMSASELEREGPVSEFNPLETYDDAKILQTENPDGIFLCPEYWCVIDKIPLTETQLVEGKCPVCGGKLREAKSKASIAEYPVLKRDKSFAFPGELKDKSSNGKSIPCCYQRPQKTRVSKLIPVAPNRTEQFYILGETKMGLQPMRFAYIHPETLKALELTDNIYDTIKRDQNRIQAGQSGIFRVGVGRPSETLPTTLGLPPVKPPIENIQATLKCSFFRSWNKPSENPPEDLAKMFSNEVQIAKIIHGIQLAYESKELSVLNELEFVCLSLNCDFFRLIVKPDGSTSVGCMFAGGFLKSMKRAIAVMFHEEDPTTVDYIGFVSRTSSTSDATVITNLFNEGVFPKTIREVLESYRQRACWNTPLPTMKHALTFVTKHGQPLLILDPYGRSQAFIYPGQTIVPFQPESTLVNYPGIGSYSELPEASLPVRELQLRVLKELEKYHKGYEYKEDLADSKGMIREIVIAAGIRIPVQPFAKQDAGKTAEIVETVRKGRERKLAFGEPNKEDIKHANNIRYESEVFEFLLFQISKNLNDYPDFKDALISRNKDSIKDQLNQWMDDAVVFHELEDPPTFVSKIRTPCNVKSKNDCSGMCAWSDNICKVDVKKFNRGAIEKRLLSALISNDKIRAIVLEERSSPFFSTVLYLEMPHELFLSDSDLAEYKNIARSE